MRWIKIIQPTIVIGSALAFTNRLSRHQPKPQYLNVVRNILDDSSCIETTNEQQELKDATCLQEEMICEGNYTPQHPVRNAGEDKLSGGGAGGAV
jgi:hypothetical protein